jgi:hypothetical protein
MKIAALVKACEQQAENDPLASPDLWLVHLSCISPLLYRVAYELKTAEALDYCTMLERVAPFPSCRPERSDPSHPA